ncbi:MAG TPA: hypothetical protein VK486_17175, partial [Thermoleophilaceae bacterium]|nr:hypothetical protein [Thermoleophilaceae bacterium]
VSRTYLRRDEEMIRVKPHRLVGVKHGDVLVKMSSGGGGVGPPWERDPEAVREDVRKEFVTRETARDIYCVALDEGTLEIDEAETQRLRDAHQS